MSWDADLIDVQRDICVGEWNYTHNTNRMATKVLETCRYEVPRSWMDGDGSGTCWFKLLDSQKGDESLAFLDLIIGGLMEAPSLFREMNPTNGWGDYDSFLAVLVSMRARAAKYPHCEWVVTG